MIIKEAIGTGSTVDAAREDAIEKLCAGLDEDVQFEIVAFPKKKVLGLFGGSDAKVRAYVEGPDPAPKKEKAQKKSPQINNKKVFFSNHIDGLVVDVLFLLFTPFWIMLLKDVYQRCISIGIFTAFYFSVLLFIFLYLFFICFI